jgi:dTDP-4-amino-4,6-dideoxygalactose transaminase
MNIPLVDLSAQYKSIKEEVDLAISDVIGATAFIGGPHLEAFEKAFASFCAAKHCIGVGNGTDALFIALRTLGIGPGDEVITVANSFIATSEAISLTGARVVFVDIDPQTYNIDVTKIEDKITSRTKAIVPVHLYGQPVDVDPLVTIAHRHDLRIVEDCAQAHGARYKNRPVGTFGDMATFSFYPGKNLGAYGDGGALITNDDELALKARMFANHGRVEKYDHATEGVNSRLDGLQAAILDVKLKHLTDWTERRRKNASFYNDCLKDTKLVLPLENKDVEAVYHLYVVRIESTARQKLQDHLKRHGVSTGIHYPIALPNLKAYSYLGHREADFPAATRASREVLSLPMFPELQSAQIEYIADRIREFAF